MKLRASPLLLFLVALPAFAAAPKPPQAAIASAHPLATAAGMQVLKEGGNAFDAAIAVSTALAVVEPYSSGLGGGGYYLLHVASDGHDVMVDGRETAPAAASHDMYLDKSGELKTSSVRRGALSAGIPGTPAALADLAKYGRLSLAQDLAPAIALARDGFKVDKRFAAITDETTGTLTQLCKPDCPFLVDGHAPEAGSTLKQPALAATLELIAAKGAAGFYAGEVAQEMVDAVRAVGGIWTLDDLKGYHIIERAPISGDYHGYHIVTAAPSASGGVVLLETLNILSAYPLDTLDSASRAHLVIEAWRRAYRDRNQYLGDPDFVKMPLARLLSPDYAARLRGGISADKATPSSTLAPVVKQGEGVDTTHFSILDKDGNMVAATQTINFRYGSGILGGKSGVILNDEMDDFSAKPGEANGFGLVQGEANAVAPGKRPLSSMTPTFVEGPRGVAIVGTPGGSRITTMVTLAVLDFIAGGSADHMTALLRYHQQYLPDDVSYEPGAFTDAELQALAKMGYSLRQVERPYGDMNVVVWDYKTGKVEAATDPRDKDALVDF
ncbi:MAG TPA: gamma-glutamyltransferase [Gammaproteobacteria bacterium]|jgi:gamma-glutamyltranspeptidase/glutathione hydrolase|nr:gamma-glutamyltransferase [Gammaproteobacteria bacterium]